MKLKELEVEIKNYLAQDQPEYFEGVELYSEHPGARKNVIINLNQRWNKQVMHEKLIYELEKLVGIEKHSGKKTVLEHRPANIPYKLIEKTQSQAPANYQYKVKFENLPAELKALVIEKGQLYNALDIRKKELVSFGQVNDDLTISKRQIILKDMHALSDKIKKIHALLVSFDKTKKFASGDVEALNRASIGGATREPEQELELTDVESLDNEFGFIKMDYYERKDLLTRLRSSVSKQEQRAEETIKPDIKERNLLKAELGRKMIAVLEQYFKDTPDPEQVKKELEEKEKAGPEKSAEETSGKDPVNENDLPEESSGLNEENPDEQET